MNIFEKMCMKVGNLPTTKKYSDPDEEVQIGPEERYRAQYGVVEEARNTCASELEKVQKEIFDLSKKEEDLQKQKTQIKEEDLQKQKTQILDYEDLLSPPPHIGCTRRGGRS